MMPVDPELLRRVAASIKSDLRPVCPMPSDASMMARLLIVFAIAALAGAAFFGFQGARRLNPLAAGAIFGALGATALVAAAAAATSVIPGARRVPPALAAFAGCVALGAIFSAVFPNHDAGRFVRQGIPCFRAGILCSIPAALLTWFVVRRGFATDRRAAGVAIGTLAAFAGVATLELHCPNFRLPHVLVWHLAVVPVGAGVGYLLGSKRSAAELMQ